MTNKTSRLQEKAKQMGNKLPLMSGREKADLETIIGQKVTIRDFGFMKDGDKDYVAFIIDQDEKHFYFGGQVLTGDMKDFEADGLTEEIQKEGLPVLFETRSTKDKKRTYTSVEYYPQ